MSRCVLCPRRCEKDRAAGEKGFCAEGFEMRIARYSLHEWEEPVISGQKGSGTIFFCGCSLKCEFCQNRAISHSSEKGKNVSVERLGEIMLELQDMGAENINLVTPTHFSDRIAQALKQTRPKLNIPIVYNSSGYEDVSALSALRGLVDVYLPDFKYYSNEIALKYSSAPRYREIAEAALLEMFSQVGKAEFEERGMLKKGLLIRHLVLPSCRKDSMAILKRISEILPVNDILISIMSQYTPDFAVAANTPHKELHRRITSFEYESVLSFAQSLGFVGFSQQKSSATARFTPDF